ncbi:hypothetical protein [Streptomyces sp. R41]|uniref:Uncharacterized protein n=1 Tax=Streptomyces sp. R41 TaxID=3238632 RepID=A0AB39RE00_9ACTN
MTLGLLPLCFRLPARLRRTYERAAWTERVGELLEGQDGARRLSLRRVQGFVGSMACWLLLIGLATHQVMPPVMLVPPAVVQWARSRATANWERVNAAALWQAVPGMFGTRGPVFRVPADGGI